MSICDRVMELSDGLADLLLAADAATDEGDALRFLRKAVDAAEAVKFGNKCARTILTMAAADVRKQRLAPDLPVPANDHLPDSSPHDPIVA
jgi:hypothetical protein